MLQGHRTELRPAQAADLPLLRRWEQVPAIAQWLGTTANLLDARESADQEYDRLLRNTRVRLLTILTLAGEVAGFVRLNDLDLLHRKAVVRILLNPDCLDQGLGTDALRTLIRFCFRELGLHRLGLVVRADNHRALHVYERLGFVVEGREREAVWSDGQWTDFVQMGLLATEWSVGCSEDV